MLPEYILVDRLETPPSKIVSSVERKKPLLDANLLLGKKNPTKQNKTQTENQKHPSLLILNLYQQS